MKHVEKLTNKCPAFGFLNYLRECSHNPKKKLVCGLNFRFVKH